MNNYKEQWNNYFEGGIAMWSYFGYEYHSYTIAKHVVCKLDMPTKGQLVQLGTGLGVTVELLANKFGEERVDGYDLFNPLRHPRIKFLDMDKDLPPTMNLAYLDIDVGSMSHARDQRKQLLNWAVYNMVEGGYILTNKRLADELKASIAFEIINLDSFDIQELWSNPHETRINTKVLLKVTSSGLEKVDPYLQTR